MNLKLILLGLQIVLFMAVITLFVIAKKKNTSKLFFITSILCMIVCMLGVVIAFI